MLDCPSRGCTCPHKAQCRSLAVWLEVPTGSGNDAKLGETIDDFLQRILDSSRNTSRCSFKWNYSLEALAEEFEDASRRMVQLSLNLCKVRERLRDCSAILCATSGVKCPIVEVLSFGPEL